MYARAASSGLLDSPTVPAISVLVPVYNARRWLPASMASLWRQTLPDFEVIAVDDGSTDGSGEWLDAAAGREPRLRVFHAAHQGLPLALNHGLARARGRLIARHDADDLSHRDRFRFQIQQLRAERGLAVSGSRLRLFPSADVGVGMRRWARWHNSLLEHDMIASEMLIDSPLAHGTAMIRRSWLERVGGWQERGWAEDLDLWIRLLEAGARFGKRPEVLYAWRQHRTSATRKDPRYDRRRFIDLKLAALRRGLLHRRRRVTVIGVGESLERGVRAMRDIGLHVDAIERGRPHPGVIGELRPPIILVFMAPNARQRWRNALLHAGLRESTEFTFVT